MGRLEKQIIAGALALVGILLVVVVYRGLDHNQEGQPDANRPVQGDWEDASEKLALHDLGSPSEQPPAAASEAASTPTDPRHQLPLAIGPEAGSGAAEEETETQATVAPEPEPVQSKVQVHELMDGVDWDPGLREYVVQPGDTLGHIAQRELGSYAHWEEILKLNEGLDPQSIQAGDLITLPTHVRSQAPQAKAAEASFDPGVRTHVIEAGDSLYKLAKLYYDSESYQRILDANPGLRKDQVLKIGTRIAVPE